MSQEEAVRRLAEFGKGKFLRGLDLRAMRDEGRK